MVVYIDLVLGLNGLLDYLLLRVCGTITASPCRPLRALLGGLLGGVYGVLTLLPGLGFLQGILWQGVFAGAVCLVAFGPGRVLLRQVVVFLLLGAAFSGIVFGLTEVFSAPGALMGGRVYYPVSFGVLVLTAGGAYGLMRWGLGRLTHQGGDIATVGLNMGEGTLTFTALRDTGNTLRDPVSGTPVLVVEAGLLGLPGGDAVSMLELLKVRFPTGNPRLIPYKTIGQPHGLLAAVRPKKVEIDGKQESLLIGISPETLSDGGGYRGLLGGKL